MSQPDLAPSGALSRDALERDLIDELGKAAATFSDLRVALELLRHESLAMACGVAEEHVRSVIGQALLERYAR